jgi:hypothetical protein
MKSLFVTLAIISCLVMSNIANAQSTLTLQEKCAEGTKKFFSENEKASFFHNVGIWTDAGGWGNTEFISHYNKKLDRCFISIKSSYHPKGKRYTYYVNGVFDVFEGTTLGEIDIHIPPETYDPFICHVGNKGCKSSEEFEALIKPYMEE